MNQDASNRKPLAARATAALSLFMFVSVSAVFVPASAQEEYYGEDEVIFGDNAPAQFEAPPPAAPPAPAADAAPVPYVPVPIPAPAPSPAAAAAPGDVAPSEETDSDEEASADERRAAAKKGGKSAADKPKSPPTPIFARPHFELGLGMTTVEDGGKPWSYIALGADIPIWKFGVFLDFELFLDNNWKISNKGWDKDNLSEAIWRKIRYVRYGKEGEPLFVKFGGLSNVTLGYGMIIDRFTNMLHYPGEKLHGLQVYVDDVTPVGLTVQTLISDFAEMGDEGGVYAARLAVRPLKTMEIPLLDRLAVGAMFAVDANVQAPARKWAVSDDDKELRDTRNKYKLSQPERFDSIKINYEKNHKGINADTVLSKLDAEDNLRKGTRSFGLWGIDVGVPIVKTDLLGVDVYGQSAFRTDDVSSWGIGVPGVALRLWKLTGNLEYRMVGGRFTPGFGYFDTYYLDERYSRNPLQSKDAALPNASLNGVLGRLMLDLFDVLSLSGTYQYMAGKDKDDDTPITKRYYEATAGVGEAVMNFVPLFSIAEAYVRNADIGAYPKYDKDGNRSSGKKAGSFDRSPGMYFGYRAGVKIVAGASLIWDYRYGWKENDNGKLVSDNHLQLQAAMRF